MAATPVPTIDRTGCHLPDFPTILAYFQTGFRGIYGQDVSLDNSTQDGQLVGLIATAVNDANAACLAAYNAFSPTTAQGTGLSRNVKINGLTREIPSSSTVDVLIGGQVGVVIAGGLVSDDAGVQWALPPVVTIPPAGQIVVTATATVPGAILAPANTVTGIVTPVANWQTVTNTAAATPGAPVETDAALRIRQAVSTLNPSRTILAGIVGSLLSLPNVTRVRGYENATTGVDANGVPPAGFALVVEGGDASTIAAAIAAKKPPGTPTVGTTSATYTDDAGIVRQIRFYRSRIVPVTYRVTIRPKANYTTAVGAQIAASLAAYTEALGIGVGVGRARTFLPAQLGGGDGSETFDLLDVQLARDGAMTQETDLAMTFDERPSCLPAYVQVVPQA